MFLCRVALTLLPVIGGACASYSQSSELIARIHHEGDSRVAYFIGIDVEFVRTFMKRYSAVPVVTAESGGSGERIDDTVILVVQGERENEAYMEMLERIIERLRIRKYVVISARTKERLQQMCAYFANQKFMRIFGGTQDGAYTFLTYADKLIPIVSIKDPLPDALRDLYGHAIRTTAQTDMPRVFWYPDSKGRLQIGGVYGQMFFSFLRMYNASFEEVAVASSNTLDTPSISRAIKDGRVELSMNNYASMLKGYFVSYPVHMLRVAVLVPMNGFLNPNQYFLRPFSLSTWTCIAVTFLYIILMDVLKDLAVGRKSNPWRCFSQTLLMLLNMSSNGLIGNAGRIHIIIQLYAFVLVSLYLNYLTSFLTVFKKIKQYDTIQELIDNKVGILIPDFIWNQFRETEGLGANLESIMVPVEFNTFDYQMNKVQNTSIAYVVQSDKGKLLTSTQGLSVKPLFHLMEEHFGMMYRGFLMHPHSPLSEILTYFIMHAKETGLVEKWDREVVSQAIKSGYRIAKGECDEASARSLSWNDLRFAWIALTAGLALAAVVFVLEILSGFVKATWARRMF